ncbi:MSMEG_0565 family glycosyltransferase [Rhizobium hainanense]|uniref:Glycosyltransferase, MSMEG_0565 family n=1 Tax=Rhizobium hainanense TaxID=52131 RepID=A0A1C3W8T2_9HYPH|nr:MSMEG_0565 family glycosyltransferase [Rhizobium hainanense]SCB36316.1 glycosyltransferase, MSMEG_0565 family [Rhizobium hainanense]
MTRRLRIAMLAHSTNPRGGVVHALALSEALCDLGHEVIAHAPDASGKGFFRSARCELRGFPVSPAPSDMTAMVEQRIEDYLRHFEQPCATEFDLFHAHDGISGNALATLKERGKIAGFLRTVHHVDAFTDPRLMDLQARSIDYADVLVTVSDHWRGHFRELGREAICVGNGVDMVRFRPDRDETDHRLAVHLAVGAGPVFLAVGGIETRKNTLAILKAFAQVRILRPEARLLIAGGVSLLDHSGYQAEFNKELNGSPHLASAVSLLGAVADEDMPALFRRADALVFPSVKEGFGLVVLEAMASDVPVVLSSIAPFTEYVPPDAAVWCDPLKPASIADAMLAALSENVRRRSVKAGRKVAARHDWRSTALAHLPAYHALLDQTETIHA